MSTSTGILHRIAERRKEKADARKARLAERDAKRAAVLLESEETARRKTISRKSSDGIMNLILLISSAVLVVCVLEIGWYYYKSYRYTKSQEEITNMMQGGIADDSFLTEITEPEKPVTFPDEGEYTIVANTKNYRTQVSDRWKEQYRYLTSVNPDCFGYIEIPDTKVQLPVMFTPEEYDYYLYRNFSGSYETRGTPFMDSKTRLGESKNYIIYAHNMYDGSAFGTLPLYLKKDYYNEHKYIYFNTAVSEGVYEIISVCLTAIYPASFGQFRYHIYGGILTKKEFDNYVKQVKRMSRYSIPATAEWGDELITLSTCYHMQHDDDGRLIVVAKRIK